MSKRLVTMSRLGCHGRWGNCLLQMAFLHEYARLHGLTVQTARWAGEHVFEIEPSPITVKLPNYYEPLHKTGEPVAFPGAEVIGKDWHGYGQYHTSYLAPRKTQVQKMFTFRQEIEDRMRPAANKLRNMGHTVVGLHARHGDYGRLIHYFTPAQWYRNWLAAIWPLLDRPVLFVAAEDRAFVKEFSDYNPQTAESLGIDLKAEPIEDYCYQQYDKDNPQPHTLDLVPDFWLLTQCHYLGIGNSTFSFTAAMLADELEQCWRSRLPLYGFETIDPWNATPLTYEMVDEYRHLPGVGVDKNPQW